MTVGNPENFKVQIKTGRDEVDNRRPCDFNNLNLKKLFAWIDSHQISSALKSELKRSASGFPHQALPSWQNNFERHLSKAQARLRLKSGIQRATKEIKEVPAPKLSDRLDMKMPTSDNFDDNFDEEIISSELIVEDNVNELKDDHEIQSDSVESNSSDESVDVNETNSAATKEWCEENNL
jgi:hypothetical protein